MATNSKTQSAFAACIFLICQFITAAALAVVPDDIQHRYYDSTYCEPSSPCCKTTPGQTLPWMTLTSQWHHSPEAACAEYCKEVNDYAICTGGTPSCNGIWLTPNTSFKECELVTVGNARRSTNVAYITACPEHSTRDAGSGKCLCDTGYFDQAKRCVPTPPKNFGCCEADRPQVGNPVSVGTGNKFLAETDYVGAGPYPLQLIRYYNGGDDNLTSIGQNWRLFSSLINPVWETVQVIRRDGRPLRFTLQGGQWIGDTDSADKLTQSATGWTLKTAHDAVETYNLSGNLVAVVNRAGWTHTFTYSDGTGGTNGGYILDSNGQPTIMALPAGMLIRLSDSAGRSLAFGYDMAMHIVKMTDPNNQSYVYRYDASHHLLSVTYPNGATRSYLYESTSAPHGLTGILDENGVRFATYAYDSAGHAVSSQHAGGADSYQLAWNNNADGTTTTTVTDPLGTVRSYLSQLIVGAARNRSQSQPAGAGSAVATASFIYDSRGNIASRTDFNGRTTTYAYEAVRNLETQRVEAAGTASARTISTQWHASYRLPLKVAEPYQLTTYVYDASGNLLSKTEQATGDASGAQGVAATATGPASTWRYTYNSMGQVLTARSPRTDIDDTTSYSYDSQGNMVSVIDTQGHVTVLSQYDAHGRAGRIADANGVVTTLTYDARGRLASKTMGGETTRYGYDGVGQLTQVTLADGGRIAYIYDDAHRLTGMADGAGNAIRYTLDAKGNRVREEVKDEQGILQRQIMRAYDALARPQQVTGGRE